MSQKRKTVSIEDDRDCPICPKKINISSEYLQQIVSNLDTVPEVCVSEYVYSQRLHACQTCSSLRSEVLCVECGCFVAFRARLKDSYCPFPGESKWTT